MEKPPTGKEGTNPAETPPSPEKKAEAKTESPARDPYAEVLDPYTARIIGEQDPAARETAKETLLSKKAVLQEIKNAADKKDALTAAFVSGKLTREEAEALKSAIASGPAPEAAPPSLERTPRPAARKKETGPAMEQAAGEPLGDISAYLNPENRGFLSTMSERGQATARQAYEDLYKIPWVNRIVGKLEIAYNQFWIDRHQEKATRWKTEMDGFDIRINTLEGSKKDIQEAAEGLRHERIPGTESLLLRLKDVEQQQRSLLNKKDRVQTKFEARDNKAKIYTNERDRVADKLISHYNEKLAPMERALEDLQTRKDELDLLTAVGEARHKVQETRLADIEQKKTNIEAAYRKVGISERQIRKDPAIRALEKEVAVRYGTIAVEKQFFAEQKMALDKKVAKADAKANPYRDKREEFVRVKEGRPLAMEVPARERTKEFNRKEEIRAHPREEARGTFEAPRAAVRPAARPEIPAAIKEWIETAACIAEWNKFLRKTHGKAAVGVIDEKDFLEATRLKKDDRLELADFKKILEKYLKFRKLPSEPFRKNMSAFSETFEQKKKDGK